MAATALAVAATVMALHGPAAFAISATPAAVHLSAGQSTTVKVSDTGTQPIHVNTGLASVAKSGAKCGINGAAAKPVGVSVSGPASFVLGPGQSRSVTVAVAQTAPMQDDALVFASTPGGQGNAHVSGGVATQLVIGGAKGCTSALPAAAHGSSAEGAGIVGIITGALIGMAFWLRRRVRRWKGRKAATAPAAAPELASINPDELAAQLKITPAQARDLLASAADRR